MLTIQRHRNVSLLSQKIIQSLKINLNSFMIFENFMITAILRQLDATEYINGLNNCL